MSASNLQTSTKAGQIHGQRFANRTRIEAEYEMKVRFLPESSPEARQAKAGKAMVVMVIRGSTEKACRDATQHIDHQLVSTVFVPIQPHQLGMVIGFRGDTIRQIRRKHPGVRITVPSSNSDSAHPNQIRLKGPAEGCQEAKRSLEEILFIAKKPIRTPSRPVIHMKLTSHFVNADGSYCLVFN